MQRAFAFVFLLIFAHLHDSNPLVPSEEVVTPVACEWRHNLTDSELTTKQKESLENCLYYNFVQNQPSQFDLMNEPPFEIPLKITIEQYVIHQVDMLQKANAQFNIHGEMFLTWEDTRLEWNEEEWKFKEFALHTNHHIWTPKLDPEGACSVSEGCLNRVTDLEISHDGTVTALLSFRYPAFCTINYRDYPEETNDCCLLLSVAQNERTIKFEIQTKERASVQRPVGITTIENEEGVKVFKTEETSAWTVKDRTIEVGKLAGIRTEFLRLCIKAKKEMSTLRIALRIPATVSSMVMLVSPLFGDLRTQSFVKLFTLTLQTICFLFLCSIAPVNGFGGTKPRLYVFYEFVFFVSFLSIFITLICLALCRVRRTVPPTHFLFLSSKLINRFFCCIEPETTYQRQLDGFDAIDSNRGPSGVPRENVGNLADYTHEWRHVYGV